VFQLTVTAIQVQQAISLSSVANSPAVGKGAKRYAIAMYGGVTGRHRKFWQFWQRGAPESDVHREESKSDVNLSIPAVMLKENLMGGPQDVYMHSWSPKYRKTLEALYHPKAAQFHNNKDYADEINRMVQQFPRIDSPSESLQKMYEYRHVSMALSISKVLKTIADYQEASGHVYDSIYLCRPDVLLRGKVDLNRSASRIRVSPEDIAEDVVFHTSGVSGHADFHYLMSGHHATVFSTMFDSLPNVASVEAVRDGGGIVQHSGWVDEFLGQHGLRLRTADTEMGYDEEVYRQVRDTPEWRSYLAPLMPPQCLDQFFSRPVTIDKDCLVDI
jgi:hypothetical protein